MQQQYADDTRLDVDIAKYNNSISVNQLKQCLAALYVWFWHNELPLNHVRQIRCHYFRHRPACAQSHINCQCCRGNYSSQVNLFGVTLDRRLSFETRICPVKDVFYIFIIYVMFCPIMHMHKFILRDTIFYVLADLCHPNT